MVSSTFSLSIDMNDTYFVFIKFFGRDVLSVPGISEIGHLQASYESYQHLQFRRNQQLGVRDLLGR